MNEPTNLPATHMQTGYPIYVTSERIMIAILALGLIFQAVYVVANLRQPRGHDATVSPAPVVSIPAPASPPAPLPTSFQVTCPICRTVLTVQPPTGTTGARVGTGTVAGKVK